MSTAADLVKSSMRVIGAIASGETPSASEQADGVEALNDILEEWSNDGFMIFGETIEEFAFSDGVQAYSIGTGATFDSLRPQNILWAKSRQAVGQPERQIDLISNDEWARISQRTLQSNRPRKLYYNQTYPNGTLNFWPVPVSAGTLILSSQKPLTSVTASTTLIYPPGYKKALKYTLAAELGPEYGQSSNPKIEDIAIKAKSSIQRMNTEPVYMISDAHGLNTHRRFDIGSGW